MRTQPRAAYDTALPRPLEEQHSCEQHGIYKCDQAGLTSRDKAGALTCGMGERVPKVAALERRQRQEQGINQPRAVVQRHG